MGDLIPRSSLKPPTRAAFGSPTTGKPCWTLRALHWETDQTSPGLIIVSQELDIGPAIEELLLVWAASEAEEWENAASFYRCDGLREGQVSTGHSGRHMFPVGRICGIIVRRQERRT